MSAGSLCNELCPVRIFRRAHDSANCCSISWSKPCTAMRTNLTEQHIGNALFHKPSDYSPLEDSSVRVHVRQLRLKLHEYFNEDGRNEPIILEIPKGSYAPVFRLAQKAEDAFRASRAKGDSSPGIVLAGDAALGPVCFSGRVVRSVGISSGYAPHSQRWACAHSPFLAIFPDLRYAASDNHRRGGQQLWDGADPFQPAGIAGPIPSPGISSGSGSQQDWCGEFPLERIPFQLDAHFVADVADVVALYRMAGPLQTQVLVRYPRDLRLRDLDHNNYVFIGSPGSNPWVTLLQDKLNFAKRKVWWETAPRCS